MRRKGGREREEEGREGERDEKIWREREEEMREGGREGWEDREREGGRREGGMRRYGGLYAAVTMQMIYRILHLLK